MAWFKNSSKSEKATEPSKVERITITHMADDTPTAHLAVDFGTSATVIAAFKRARENNPPPTHFIVGGTAPFSSAIATDKAGTVKIVGRGAETPTDETLRLVDSLKRVIEERSRDPKARLDDLTTQVTQYVHLALSHEDATSLDPGYLLTGNSRVFISVPNGFNARAVRVIRDGVWQGLKSQFAAIDQRHVYVIREGEAVARFWMQTGCDSSRWHQPRFALQPAQEKPAGPPRLVVVLDIGAGTTDMTVVDNRNIRAPRILLNAGVPLGGTDIDRMLLGAMAVDDFWPAKDRGAKVNSQIGLRRIKERDGLNGFIDTRYSEWTAGAEIGVDSIRNFEDAAPFFRQRLTTLVSISVRGLFALLPRSLVNKGITDIVMTGRGSQVFEIGAAVEREARSVGNARLHTLLNRYDLKRAVTHGCIGSLAAIPNGLPASTLGRQLVITEENEPKQLKQYLEADTRWSGDVPTLWRLSTPSSSYWNEHHAVLLQAVADEEKLGLIRRVADRPQADHAPMLVLWSTEDRHYHPSQTKWAPLELTPMDGINALTGLPFGFPNEAP